MVAITRIAYDHMAELGDSLALIAGEKAGIIKRGSRVVLGKIHPEARAVIEAKAAAVGAPIVELASPEPIAGAPLAYPRVALVGSNLAVAVTVARELGISPEVMAQGIEQTTWPGRNELLHRSGQELTLLDCAHNPDGAVALSHALDPSVLGDIESRKEIVLVFGALTTKNWRAMLRRLETRGWPPRVRRAAHQPARRSERDRRVRAGRSGELRGRSAGSSTRASRPTRGRGRDGLDVLGRRGARVALEFADRSGRRALASSIVGNTT